MWSKKIKIITAIVVYTHLNAFAIILTTWQPSKRTVSVFLNYSLTYYHKHFDEQRVLTQPSDFVNGDVTITGDKSSSHFFVYLFWDCRFASVCVAV